MVLISYSVVKLYIYLDIPVYTIILIEMKPSVPDWFGVSILVMDLATITAPALIVLGSFLAIIITLLLSFTLSASS